MNQISRDELKKSIEKKLMINSMTDLRNANNFEIRMALNEVIKDLVIEEFGYKPKNSSEREYIVSFELMLENLLEDYVEKLGLKRELQEILSDNYDEVINMGSNLHLGQTYIGRFAVDLFEKISMNCNFCKIYSLFYKNSQFKQKIINGEQIETSYGDVNRSVVFNRLKEYSFFIDGKEINSKIYDIPYIENDGVNLVRLFKPKPKYEIDYENFINGNLAVSYKTENEINAISEFLYIPENSEFGKNTRYLQLVFLTNSIIEDVLNDEIEKFGNLDNIDEHIKIRIVETNCALVIIKFIQKLFENGIGYGDAIKKAKKIFNYYNINLHRESFENLELSRLIKMDEEILNTVNIINDYAINDGFMDIVQGGILNCFNMIAYITDDIVVGSNFQKDYFLKSEYVELEEKVAEKLMVVNYGFNDKLFEVNNLEDDLYEKKLIFKNQLLQKYNLTDVNPKSIFNMQISDFHEGKRQILSIFYILYLYLKLKENVNYKMVDTTFFIGGMSPSDYLICKKAISLCTELANVINNDRFIQEKIKLIFVENIEIDQMKDFARACDVNNYIPYKYYDISNSYPYAFMNNGCVLVSSNSSVYDSMSNLNLDSGIFEFEDGNSNLSIQDYIARDDSINFIIQNISKLGNENLTQKFYDVYDLLLKYDDSFYVLRSLKNFIEINKIVQKAYLDENKWNRLVGRNIEMSKKFAIGLSKNG